MANRNFPNGGKIYMEHVNAALLDCEFTVAATNASGVTGLKGGLIPAVYMHTSTTPSAGNPNPAAGYAIVQLGDNFNGLYGCYSQLISPNSGSSLLVASAGLTAGLVYTITIMGTTTVAAWHTLGVPAGIAPAVGVSFVAANTSAVGTGAVQVPKVTGSGALSMELMGNPNLQLISSNPNQGASGYYPYLIFRFMSATAAAPTFSGSALGTHAHDLLIKGGQAASTTNDIAYYATDILGKEQATDATIAGSASATKGGVIAISAGTPAGTISAPAISMVLATPADGTVVKLGMLLSNSSVTVGSW